jgi:hypothetical protein
MIGWRKIFALFSTISYILLVFFYFKPFFGKSKTNDQISNCSSHSKPCLRFCKDVKSDDELFLKFTKSKYSELDDRRNYKIKPGGELEFFTDDVNFTYTKKYLIFRGEPECINKEIREYNSNYDYDEV